MSLLVVKNPGADQTSYTARRGSIGSKRGWCFASSDGLFVSALYKTKSEAEDEMVRYIKTGKFDWYGSAE